MMITVTALQLPLGRGVTLEDKLHLIRRRPDFLCLPEYSFVRPSDHDYSDGNALLDDRLAALADLSRELGCAVIGGTLPHQVDGGYANIATVFNRGAVVGSYQKRNPYGREEQRGIIPGSEFRVFDIEGIRVGVLICADVLSKDSFAAMGRLGAEVIFVPTVSPHRDDDTMFEKDRRDASIFVVGASSVFSTTAVRSGLHTLNGSFGSIALPASSISIPSSRSALP